LELGIAAGGHKNQNDGGIGPRKKFEISSAIWIQYTNVTNGHRATAKTALTHSIAR